MRTVEQERARYTWMTPRQFGEAIGVGEEHVRDLIRDGVFPADADPPEVLDVRRPGSRRPEYRLSAEALARFYRERAAMAITPRQERAA